MRHIINILDLSVEEIEIAGPAEQIDKLEKLDLGVIDVRYLDGESSYTFTVELPGGYLNIEGVQEVTASFTNPNIDRQRFTVSNIQLAQELPGYDVSISTKSIYSVQMIGLASDIQQLENQDLVARVQLDEGEILSVDFRKKLKEDIDRRYEEARKEEERNHSVRVMVIAFLLSLFLWLLGKGIACIM